MSTKLKSMEELKLMSPSDISSYKSDITDEKIELEALKVTGGEYWNKEKQERLDELALHLVDIDEVQAAKKGPAKKGIKADKAAYVPANGTERFVHVRIVRGKKFDPNTGKPLAVPYVHMLTYGEWQVFKDNHKRLGYTVEEVLYNPYEK